MKWSTGNMTIFFSALFSFLSKNVPWKKETQNQLVSMENKKNKTMSYASSANINLTNSIIVEQISKSMAFVSCGKFYKIIIFQWETHIKQCCILVFIHIFHCIYYAKPNIPNSNPNTNMHTYNNENIIWYWYWKTLCNCNFCICLNESVTNCNSFGIDVLSYMKIYFIL